MCFRIVNQLAPLPGPGGLGPRQRRVVTDLCDLSTCEKTGFVAVAAFVAKGGHAPTGLFPAGRLQIRRGRRERQWRSLGHSATSRPTGWLAD